MNFRGTVRDVLSLPKDLKLIFSAHVLWTFGEGLYSFILPVYVMELGGAGMEIGFLYSFMFLVYALSVLLGGFLADRFDRKKLILFIFTFGSVSALIYSFATEWWHLVPGMLVYSLATIGGPAENSYIAALISKERMARAFTFTEMGYSLGLIFSPLLGLIFLLSGACDGFLGSVSRLAYLLLSHCFSYLPRFLPRRKYQVRSLQTFTLHSKIGSSCYGCLSL